MYFSLALVLFFFTPSSIASETNESNSPYSPIIYAEYIHKTKRTPMIRTNSSNNIVMEEESNPKSSFLLSFLAFTYIVVEGMRIFDGLAIILNMITLKHVIFYCIILIFIFLCFRKRI